jgi:serine/threonine protein kinase
LKQLNSDNDASKFEMELKSLLYCQHHEFVDEALLREGKKHMAHVRASFEVRNSTNSKTDYYFLFDWQSGNLSQFWQNEEKLRDNEDHPLWMSQQIFGLAAALQCVHNDRSAHQTPDRKLNNVTVYGRHGDLGPSNILYSRTENGLLELKLTDFGLAQLHSRVSRSFGNDTFTPKTETYGGPDYDIQDGYISRATDIFSFGCVVLEFITWYLLGHKALQAFSESRFQPESHRQGFETDKYYSIVPIENGQKAVLKEQVLKHIFDLEHNERCSWYLYEMLHLVRDKMLNPEPKKRMQSHQLTKRLNAICKTCETDRSYYTVSWKSGGYFTPFLFSSTLIKQELILTSSSKEGVANRHLKSYRVLSSPVTSSCLRLIKRVRTNDR